MKLVARALPVLLMLMLSIHPCLAQAEGEFGSYPFSGSVESLPKEYRSGSRFEGWPGWRNEIDWMSIPGWLAGEWAANDYRITKRFDHNTGELYSIPKGSHAPYRCHFGDLADRQGSIWSANIVPDIKQIQLAHMIDCENTVKIKVLEIQNQGVVIFQRLLHALYDPSTYIIHESYTEERVTEFTPSNETMILARITNRFYDSSGNPTQTTNATRVMRRTSPFRPVRNRNNVDLHLALCEHLEGMGRADLIPQ